MRHRVAVLLLALLASACSSTDAPAQSPVATTESPAAVAKSPNDSNDYRALTLDNGLRVLLASDPDTDKAAAALTVFRGSNSDPDNRLGLAHFLEHMLFIGTEKYPELDGYQKFLTQHSGSSNAYTAADHTNYFFDVAPDRLNEALDRFAQFFIAPLLDPDYVDRERNAVHSEYQLQLKDDNWRAQAVSRAISNPQHPMSRFHIGSLDTLQPEGLHADVVAFFETQYSADQMALVVYGSDDLDSLEATVRASFSGIKNRQLGPATTPPPILTEAELQTLVRYQSQRQVNELSYTFALPSLDDVIDVRPDAYVAELLGHEGEGSLYNALKTRGWISSLGAISRRLDAGNHLLSVTMELTPGGLDHVDDIGAALFEMIRLIRRNGVSEAFYDEQARIADLNFRFREPGTAMRFVYLTAPRLMQFDATEVLRTPALMQRYDARAIRAVLAQLTPENVSVELSGPALTGPKTEPWFQVPYGVEPFELPSKPAAVELALPAPNPYLPEDLTLLEDDSQAPAEVVSRPGLGIWADRDTSFGAPRANTYLGLAVAGGLRTASDLAAAQIYASYVDEVLTPTLYPATLAGLHYSLRPIDRGYQLSVHGFSDKQLTLLDTLLAALPELPIETERFNRIRDRQVRIWRDAITRRPYEQAIAALSQHLIDNRFDEGELADAGAALTAEALTQWRDLAFAGNALLALAQGNVDDSFVASLSELADNRLRLTDVEPFEATLELPEDVTRIERPVDHDDAAMVLYVAQNSEDLISQATARLTVQLLQQAYFTELRTQAQLGYVVTMTNASLKNWPGIAFIVQSPVAGPDELEQASLDFIARQRAVISRLEATTFEAVREALAKEIVKADTSSFARSARYWSNLMSDRPTDYAEQLAAAVRGVKQASFAEAFDEVLQRIENNRVVVTSPGKFR